MAQQIPVALVTGANRGIGREVAERLAQLGVATVLGARDPAAAEPIAAALAAAGRTASVVALDVSDQESVAAAVAEVVRRHGRIDILINNAGISLERPDRRKPLRISVFDVAPAIVRQSFEVNALGALLVLQAVVPHMRRTGYGRIVNMSSVMGQLASMGAGAAGYRMSKAAMNALTRTAAAELAGTDIKINAMHPGWVRTDMGGPDAPVSVAEAAETALWLATLTADGPSGGFFEAKRAIAW